MNPEAANTSTAAPTATAARADVPGAVSMVFVAGTPLASWLDAAATWCEAAGRTLRRIDDFERWIDDVVGVDSRAWARQSAWAGGKALSLSEAQQLALRRLSVDGPSMAIDARACWVLDALADAHPGARYLLFVDPPARALSAWLDRCEGDDPRVALRVWESGARRLLRHVHRHRSTCLMVDAEESRRDPAAMAGAFRGFVGWGADASMAAGRPGSAAELGATDPLAWALAEALLAQEPGVRALYEELRAATVALVVDEAQPPSLAWASRLDASAAAKRWQELSATWRDAGRLRQLAAERDEQLQATLAQHQDLQEQLNVQFDALRKAEKLAAERDEQLQATLAQHEHLRAALAASEEREQDAQAASKRHDLRLRQLQEQLNVQFDALRKAEKLAAERAEKLEKADAERRKQADLASQRLAQFEEQSQRAKRQSQRLEHTLTELKSFEGSRTHSIGALVDFEVAQATFGAERAEAPHRQLDAALHGVRCGGRRYARLDVRLVHHLGRVGLLFFAAADAPPPVAAWHETGREGDRSFMLLFPSEAAAQGRLATLGTTDWGLVLGVAATLGRELRAADARLHARWNAVAQQLQAQLHDLPERLRYDAVRMVRAADDAAPSLTVTFERVVVGARVLPALALQWWPAAPPPGLAGRGALALLAPADASGPPLLDAWTVDDSGAWAKSLPLPFGGHIDPRVRRRAWAEFSDHDRRFVVALLGALPAAARARPDGDLPEGLTRPTLEAAARQLQVELRRLVVGAAWRRWVKLLRERLSRR